MNAGVAGPDSIWSGTFQDCVNDADEYSHRLFSPTGISKWLLWLGVLLQVTVHTLTALFWAPIQASMATPQGMSVRKYHQLMSTHWLRVSFFLAYAALMIWMVTRSLSREQRLEA
jgi:magnesium-transporting ATPase (P-type)